MRPRVSRPVAASSRARRGCSARPSTCSDRRDRRATTRGRGWTRRLADRPVSAARRDFEARRRGEPRPGATTRSCASPATASTRSRSARCTRASSSRGTSASQVVGEKVLRLEERLGYTHKGIEKRFEPMSLARRASARRTRLGRLHRRLCVGLRAGARGDRQAPRSRRARMAARAAARARARRQPPRRPRRARQRRRRSRSAWPSSRACARTWLRRRTAGLRPSPDDGLRRARAASRAIVDAARRSAMRAQCDAIAARSRACCAHLRRARRPAGPLRRHRARDARELAAQLGLTGLAAPRQRASRRSARATSRLAAVRQRSACAMATHARRRRRGARRGALRRAVRVAAPDRGDARRAAATARIVREAAGSLRRRRSARAGSKAGAGRCLRRARSAAPAAIASVAATATIRRGRTGRCSSTR